MALRWRDKEDVQLSIIHNARMVDVEDGQKKKKMKPQAVTEYNDIMGGVDLVDQNLSNYPAPRKQGKKYYKKIFFNLLKLAL
jgi:hypothetical protein